MTFCSPKTPLLSMMLRLYEMIFHPSTPVMTVLSASGVKLSNTFVSSDRRRGKKTRNYTVHVQYHEFCLKEMPLNT